MELTPFGYAFLPLLLAILLFARQWLPGVVFLAMVFQAASVLDVTVGPGRYGVSPYMLVAVAAACVLAGRTMSARGLHLAQTTNRRAIALLLGFALVAIVGAFVLPIVFKGVPVFALLNPLGFGADPVPLTLGISQLAQAANLALHMSVLLFLLQAARRPDWKTGRMLWGLAIGVGLTIAIGVYERAALSGGPPSLATFWMSNPGYAQGHGAEVGGVLRVSAPFSEPSYGSTFLAAVLTGLMAVAAFGRSASRAAVGAVLVGLAMLNTLGTTGIAAAGLSVVVIVAALTSRALSRGPGQATAMRRASIVWLAMALAALVVAWLVLYSPVSSEVSRVLERGFVSKLKGGVSLSTFYRERSNDHAVQLLIDTWGLGVGLGGNRASSYFTSLLSNAGLFATLLYFGLLAAIARPYRKATGLGDAQIFAIAAMLGATTAMGIGIPDLNFPAYWGFIFLALLLCPPELRTTKSTPTTLPTLE